MIVVENLSFSRQGRRVLNGLNFTIAPGVTALLGHNGAGKSTLFSILATVFKPSQGTIYLRSGNQEIKSRQQVKSYRKHIALVPQHYTPVPGLTVEEHIRYVSWLASNPAQQSQALTQKAIALTRLQDLAQRKATELSGGETQRLALAGALATGATVLLLDEPTAGLDPSHKNGINQLISAIGQDHAVLVATHDLYQFDEIYQRVLALSCGNLTFSGSTREFLDPFTGSPQERALAAFDYFMVQE